MGRASPLRKPLLVSSRRNISASGLEVAIFSVSLGTRLVSIVVSPLRVVNLIVQGEPALAWNKCWKVNIKLLVATVQLAVPFPVVAQARLLPRQKAQARLLEDPLYCL